MRKLVNTVLAGALGLSMMVGVTAQEVDNIGDATINVGPNENGLVNPLITQAPDFGTVQYSVDDQTATNPAGGADNLVLEITDNRGGSEGWQVNISGTNFANEGATDTFDVTNLVLGTGEVTSTVGEADNITAHGNQGVTTQENSLVEATNDVGSNGVFTVIYTGNELNVPGGTPVNEYSSTLTVTVPSAPE